MAGILKVRDGKVADGDGNSIILRGVGLGGWMKYVKRFANHCSGDC